MAHENLVSSPKGVPLLHLIGRSQSPSEKSKLVTKPASILILEVTGVVPPFCLVVRMRPIIIGKVPGIGFPGASETVWSGGLASRKICREYLFGPGFACAEGPYDAQPSC
jgi:hypothetical protein